MDSTPRRWTGWSVPALLLFGGLLAAQAPDVPPFQRDQPPGDPPPVPGAAADAARPAPAGDGAAEAAPPAADADGEVQGRGPLHEGFARPGQVKPPSPPIVPKKPPPAINEVPPDEKPEGDNVVWIPGYWGWDEERTDFLWVSGFWRVAPPGRKWVPGYWAEADGGWRWVAGLWADAAREEMPYLSPPPETLDNGPSVPAPDEGYSYVPGTWTPGDEQWLWSPGYWCAPRPGWIYTPPCYTWTPGGYLFTSGFWDHCLEARGVPFAPVWFSAGVWNRPGFCFTPRFTLGIGGMLGSLWICGGGRSYAFGDFYGPRFAGRGFQPWAVHGARVRDPLYQHYRHQNRGNPAWRRDLVTLHDGRQRGTIARPPHTLAAQQRLTAGRSGGGSPLLQPLSNYRNANLRLARISEQERTRRGDVTGAFRQASLERQRAETNRPVGGRAALSLARVPNLPGARPGAAPTRLPRSGNPAAPSGVARPSLPGADERSTGRLRTERAAPPASRPLSAANDTRPPAPGQPRRSFGNDPASRPGLPPPTAGNGRPAANDTRPPVARELPPAGGQPRRSFGNDPASRPGLPPPTAGNGRPADVRPDPRLRSARAPDDDTGLRFNPRPAPPRGNPTPPSPRLTMPSPAPRMTAPQPRVTTPTPPRISTPAPAMPRYSAPAAMPRFSAPATPRFSAPAAMPRFSAPATPRFSAPARSFGGMSVPRAMPGGGRGGPRGR